jgi:hypothetical protein
MLIYSQFAVNQIASRHRLLLLLLLHRRRRRRCHRRRRRRLLLIGGKQKSIELVDFLHADRIIRRHAACLSVVAIVKTQLDLLVLFDIPRSMNIIDGMYPVKLYVNIDCILTRNE